VKYWRKPLDLPGIRIPHGIIHVLTERCKGCGFCIEFCPRHVLAESEQFNSKGYHPPIVVDSVACISCGYCELICPEFAIYREEELQEVTSL
jgi:2-oxoglutarate ferredoxin oxidoreductase subunit delta